MVDYSTWFGLVQSEANVTFEERGELTQEIAAYWESNRSDLEAMSKREARQLARDLLG